MSNDKEAHQLSTIYTEDRLVVVVTPETVSLSSSVSEEVGAGRLVTFLIKVENVTT